MGAAKKRQIGFVTTKEKEGKGSRKLPVGPLSEGPRLGFLNIRITHGQFSAIEECKFVRLRLSSRDGKFLLDMIVRDADSFLELVPKKMPGIMIDMDAKTFMENVAAKTIIRLDDGARSKGFAIADIQRVDMMDAKWTFRKRMKS
jgi:hypothetical protein